MTTHELANLPIFGVRKMLNFVKLMKVRNMTVVHSDDVDHDAVTYPSSLHALTFIFFSHQTHPVDEIVLPSTVKILSLAVNYPLDLIILPSDLKTLTIYLPKNQNIGDLMLPDSLKTLVVYGEDETQTTLDVSTLIFPEKLKYLALGDPFEHIRYSDFPEGLNVTFVRNRDTRFDEEEGYQSEEE